MRSSEKSGVSKQYKTFDGMDTRAGSESIRGHRGGGGMDAKGRRGGNGVNG
jgi:hypothetical protein